MPKITSQEALDLAKLFKEAALALGQFQLSQWDSLSKNERRRLTDDEYTLLDHSQNLITYAVGVMLDDAQASLDQIKNATTAANQAIKTINDIEKVIAVSAALVTLGAAIYSGNPSGVADAVTGLVGTVGKQPST
jgi:hypothetical protein